MSHPTEEIIDAVATLLRERVPLVSTDNVFPHRSYPLNPDELPALCVKAGKDDPVREFDGGDEGSLIDSLLNVHVLAYARDKDEESLRRTLLALRGAVQNTLLSDLALGLVFVVYISYGGADESDLDSSAELLSGAISILFLVQYRMPASAS